MSGRIRHPKKPPEKGRYLSALFIRVRGIIWKTKVFLIFAFSRKNIYYLQLVRGYANLCANVFGNNYNY